MRRRSGARLGFPLASRMSSDELLAATSAAFMVLLAALIAARLVPAAARAGRGIALTAAVVLAVTGTSAVYRLATVDLPTFAVVVAGSDTDVRFEPSANGTAHFATKPGAVLRVLADREGWAQVARRRRQARLDRPRRDHHGGVARPGPTASSPGRGPSQLQARTDR